MNKKEAIQAMLDGKKVTQNCTSEGWEGCYYNGFFQWSDTDRDHGEIKFEQFPNEGWEIYEEPLKEEAPEYIDVEVVLEGGSLCVDGWMVGQIIGRFIERHDTRYFATWYIVGCEEDKYPVSATFSEHVKATFASHVRFVREDLLGGIPE